MGLLSDYKEVIYNQRTDRNRFMELLMKQRNQKGKWTKEELNELKSLCSCVPYSMIFTSPFGFLLFPFLARLLDRRREIRFA